MRAFWRCMGAVVVCLVGDAFMPGAWAEMRPSTLEIGELAGLLGLVVSAYVSLFARRSAAWMSLLCVGDIAAFVIVRTARAGEEKKLVAALGAVALASCLAAAWISVATLRNRGGAKVSDRGRKWILIGSGVCLALWLTGLWSGWDRRDPSRYVVPEGYVGWVVIRHGIPGAAPTPKRDGALEYVIPPSGKLETSSKQKNGFALDDWEAVDAAGVRTKLREPDVPGGTIWRWSAGSLEEPGKPDLQTEQFFVGTEEQLETIGEKSFPELVR